MLSDGSDSNIYPSGEGGSFIQFDEHDVRRMGRKESNRERKRDKDLQKNMNER